MKYQTYTDFKPAQNRIDVVVYVTSDDLASVRSRLDFSVSLDDIWPKNWCGGYHTKDQDDFAFELAKEFIITFMEHIEKFKSEA